MLKNIHRLLGPEVLYVLHRMGHGDEIALVDANFPAESCARRLLRTNGVSATAMLEAILSVFPLDEYVDCPVHTMQVVGNVDARPEIVREFLKIVKRSSPESIACASLDREAFYARARAAFAVLATGEERLYGNILLTKGVVSPRKRRRIPPRGTAQRTPP